MCDHTWVLQFFHLEMELMSARFAVVASKIGVPTGLHGTLGSTGYSSSCGEKKTEKIIILCDEGAATLESTVVIC